MEKCRERVRKYDCLFGGTFYNTAFVLWAFLLQCLSDGKSRSCSTAVGRIVSFCMTLGQSLPDQADSEHRPFSLQESRDGGTRVMGDTLGLQSCSESDV